jgi:hypothetical protein
MEFGRFGFISRFGREYIHPRVYSIFAIVYLQKWFSGRRMAELEIMQRQYLAPKVAV